MKKALLGAHLSYRQDTQLLGTIQDAVAIGATSGAFYISKSRSYLKFEQNKEIVQEAKTYAKKNNINLENFIVHSPLVGNIANIVFETRIYEKTFKSYLEDLKMLEVAGIKFFNFHPGSAANKPEGIKRIAKAINDLHSETKGNKTILLLETMMAKGNLIGSTFQELSLILDLVEDKDRVGVCFDTCHVWDAGYDIKNNIDAVLEEFDKVIGLKYLKAMHINDSKNEMGSNKDRHECIGKGKIGAIALKKIVNHKLLMHLPKALETPYGSDDFTKWKDEIDLLIN